MPRNKKKFPVIYAFIDSQNLNLGTSKDIYRGRKRIYTGWKLDFKNEKSESSLLKPFQKYKTFVIFEKKKLEMKP